MTWKISLVILPLNLNSIERGCIRERGDMKMEIKCGIKGCPHRGGRVINPKNPQGRYINLCFHHQVELFTEYLRRYYSRR
ncbi:MAG: hypothetical protein WAM14_12710 [Candidatus Nitrosopolaris sp.]